MLEVDYLVVADAAAAAEGKHYIHGAGWDTLFAAAFPATHPTLSVAIRLRVPWSDTERAHALELDIIDADGRSILAGTLSGNLNAARPNHLTPGNDQVIPLAFNLIGLRFDRPGTYAIVFRIDGRDLARSPFNVAPMPTPPPA